MSNDEVNAILRDLARVCENAEERFRNAAESVQNSEFRRLFNIFSQQREQFVAELQAEVHRLGGRSERPSASITGATSIRRSTTGNSEARDEAAIIAVCQREEKAALEAYEQTLKHDLPPDVQYVVKRQHMDIKDAYDRLRILQRAA
jgi:uncharacterized protein (TIGR02284 family)